MLFFLYVCFMVFKFLYTLLTVQQIIFRGILCIIERERLLTLLVKDTTI